MLTPEDLLDSNLFDQGSNGSPSLSLLDEGADGDSGTPWSEPGYEGSVDYRIRQLSYSSILTLHSCPRKYQLYKLRTRRTADSDSSSITFAFGHVIGEAIQTALTPGATEGGVIFQAFLHWEPELFADDPKLAKSFWAAALAIKRFFSARSNGFLADYELVQYGGKYACELSFAIQFPDGFRYRGHVDAVLRHCITGEVLVLECKTTGSATINPATYKNSAQAIGYSIVLDSIFPELSSYRVLYLVYSTKSGEYNPIEFTKTYLQRALWIQELLLDIEMIKSYEDAGVYPMHGESCYSFFRECEYLNTCTLSTEHLAKPCTQADEDKTEYQLTLTLADLLDTQLEKLS